MGGMVREVMKKHLVEGWHLPAMASSGGGWQVEQQWEQGCFVMIVFFWTKVGGSLANLPSIQQKGCTYLGICNSY